MTETKKLTKREALTAIAGILDDEGYAELVEFVEKEIAALEAKALKAAARAAAKAAEPDEFEAIVAGALTTDFQTAADLQALVGTDDLTIGKIRARLTKLVKAGVAEKDEVKVDGHTVMAYRLV